MKVVIVGMIYKSTNWLDFMMDNIKTYCKSFGEYDVDHLIIANDASPDVLSRLSDCGINYVEYNDPIPDDYYLNRVYRAWNFGGREAEGDIIVFVNSDMAFTDGWLERLLKYLTPNTIPVSFLIESGKMPSGLPAVGIDCGKTVNTFNRNVLEIEASRYTHDFLYNGGLYMPCALYKDDFLKSGGYPEGNIYTTGVGKFGAPFIRSGDDHFFHYNDVMKNKKHITVMNSVVYHFQTGEMDSID